MGMFTKSDEEVVDLYDESGYEIFDITALKVVVRISDDFIRIARKATVTNTILQGLDGEKTIDMHQITGYQLKEPGKTRGYLQLIYPGSQDAKSGVFNATQDENTIMFDKKDKPQIKEIKQRIDAAILAKYKTN